MADIEWVQSNATDRFGAPGGSPLMCSESLSHSLYWKTKLPFTDGEHHRPGGDVPLKFRKAVIAIPTTN